MNLAVWIPVFIIVFCMAINIPVFYSLTIGALSYFVIFADQLPDQIIVQRLIAITETSSYLAIPFFVTAGVVMNFAGISSRLLNLADGLVGHLTGGLAHVNVLLSAMMGGISGSAAADAAMETKILVPEMLKRGYDKSFSASVTIASSLITPIIPPGMGLIIYSYVVGVSVGRMFAAGYLPGTMLAVFFMIYCYHVSKKKGYKPSRKKMAASGELKSLAVAAFSALLIPFGIILSLRFGIFTATEAGAVTALYAFIIGVFVYKEIKWDHIWPMLKESVIGTATVMMMICAANAFTYFFTYEQIPVKLTNWMLSLNLNHITFLLTVNLILIIIGMFMEGAVPLIILAPLLAPVAQSLGIDMIHFGLVFCFNVCLGNMTPPFGIVLYQVAGLMRLDLVKLSKAVTPFVIIMLLELILITYIPQITLLLPNLIYGV